MTAIVSLTAIPPRFKHFGPTLESLLQQTAKIDEIRLYIPRHYRRFPDYDGTLPEVPKGIRIMQVSDDLGPASKVLFAAKELRGIDCDLIYCDDDRLYHADQFSRMIAEGRKLDRMCIAVSTRDVEGLNETAENRLFPRAVRYRKNMHYRLKRVLQFTSRPFGGQQTKPTRPVNAVAGYADIARGFGAVLVRPDFFDDVAFDIPDVLWSVDDIWLSGQMARLNVPIWAMANMAGPGMADGEDVSSLLDSVIDGANRQEADQACVRYMQDTYGIWL
ncbi:hypothetical protein BC777_1685 [Yoonia maricola]|uniref:Glycosyl transferase family 2 n=1 Tax=Yoonia maricola TaxID=420999 RepID=A0A2M8WPH8_9RHOB|nr:glycosyltransferase [Yoonia maricola]PJI92823.1 hypothetical protein BC777_1685 [Yoonia maricola]